MVKFDKSKLKEEDHQKMFVKYLAMLKAKGKVIEYFAPMGENKQSFNNRLVAQKIQKKAEAMGKLKGVSDLCVILKNRVLFIEMKKDPKVLQNGKLSTAGIKVSEYQKQFLNTIQKSDVCTGVVCYGFDEAKSYIDSQINIDETLEKC